MKKLILTIALLLGGLMPYAGSLINKANAYVNPNYEVSRGHARTGQNVSVSLVVEDHTVYFDGDCEGMVLQLIGEDGVVYYEEIAAGVDAIELPADLSGEFEIQLINDDNVVYDDIIEL